MIEEIWRPVLGYEGLYEASNLGNVRAVNYNGNTHRTQIIKQRHRKYADIMLCKNGIQKRINVHKIVYQAFNGYYERPAEIDHIDGNCLNNRLDNLKLVKNRYENIHNEITFKRFQKANYKKVRIVELNKEFDSLASCAKFLGLATSSSVCAVLKGNSKTCKGYRIEYVKE